MPLITTTYIWVGGDGGDDDDEGGGDDGGDDDDGGGDDNDDGGCCWAPTSKNSFNTSWSEHRKKLVASSCLWLLVSSEKNDGWILEMLCG